MAVEFEAWPKIPRWNREVTLTEKVDGTNACIIITDDEFGTAAKPDEYRLDWDFGSERGEDGRLVREHSIYAQSRTRMIKPGKTTDNYGFAHWVQGNALGLINLLGPGWHFGEWYGQGIQRGYGLDHKRFALFNVQRWSDLAINNVLSEELRIDVVPVMARIPSPGHEVIKMQVDILRAHGSILRPGFMKPEGVVLYHSAAKQTFKILLENDGMAKGAVAA